MEKLPTSSRSLRYLPFLVASAFFMQMLDATILNPVSYTHLTLPTSDLV